MRTSVFMILVAVFWLISPPLDAAMDGSRHGGFKPSASESSIIRAERLQRKAKALESLWLYDIDPDARRMVDEDEDVSVYNRPLMRDDKSRLPIYGRDYARVVNPELAESPMTLADAMIESVRDDARRKQYRDEFDSLANGGKDTANDYYGLYAKIVRDEALRKWEENKEARLAAQRDAKRKSRWQALRKTVITGLLIIMVTSLASIRRHTWLQIEQRICGMAGRVSKSVPKTTFTLAFLTLVVATVIPAASGNHYFEKCLGFGAIVAGCMVPFFLLVRFKDSPLKRAFEAYRKDDPGKALVYFSFVAFAGFLSYISIVWLVRELRLP